ncbi:MAG: hypothetical protein ABI986_08960, partial [Chloroflexota bacterium]
MRLKHYDGLDDLNAMLDLLSEGSQAQNGTHYVHRGDLQWLLFYTDLPSKTWQANIHLWMEADRLVGWTLLSPEQDVFDVYTIPA